MLYCLQSNWKKREKARLLVIVTGSGLSHRTVWRRRGERVHAKEPVAIDQLNKKKKYIDKHLTGFVFYAECMLLAITSITLVKSSKGSQPAKTCLEVHLFSGTAMLLFFIEVKRSSSFSLVLSFWAMAWLALWLSLENNETTSIFPSFVNTVLHTHVCFIN